MRKKFSIGFALTIIALVTVFGAVLASGSPPGSGWWSAESIMNVSTETGNATVQAVAYDSASSKTYTAEKTIAQGGAETFVPSDFTGMPEGFMGSAVVSSDREIRAIVNITNRPAGGWGVTGGRAAAAYQGFLLGDTTLSFPSVKNDYYDKTTTFYIQNAGTEAKVADVTFFSTGNSYHYETPIIQPGAMVAVSPQDTTMPDGNTNAALGSMIVTSDAPLAGIVLEHYTTENPATSLTATRGFVTADADSTVYVPSLKHNYYNRWTGLAVQNANATGDVDVTVTYTGAEGACKGNTYVDQRNDLPAGESHVFKHLNAGTTNLPVGCLASAKVEATGGNVVAMINEAYMPGTTPQEFTQYFALPASSATEKVSFPAYKEDSYSKWTGLMVQNVSGGSVNVTLTFVGTGGTFVSQPQTLADGAALKVLDARFYPGTFWNGTPMTPGNLGCAPNGCGGAGLLAVTAEANGDIVGIANESPYPGAAVKVKQDKNNYEGFNLAP